MINHKFIKNIDLELLSNQFLSPLFLIELKKISTENQFYSFKKELELHSDFIWEAVKK